MARNKDNDFFADNFIEDAKLLLKIDDFDIYLKKSENGTIGFAIDTDHSFAIMPADEEKRDKVINAINNYKKENSQNDMILWKNRIEELLSINKNINI